MIYISIWTTFQLVHSRLKKCCLLLSLLFFSDTEFCLQDSIVWACASSLQAKQVEWMYEMQKTDEIESHLVNLLAKNIAWVAFSTPIILNLVAT